MINSILLVDDNEKILELYYRLLKQALPSARIDTSKLPTHACKIAFDNFYDICLIDITMNYHGSMYGGVEIYNVLRNRYGSNSLLAYSQYIKDELLKLYQCSFNFIEKGRYSDPMEFINVIAKTIKKYRNEQTCFIAMPFANKYDNLYKVIEKAIKRSHYIPIRIDKQVFTASIIDKIYEEIEKSKVIIFVATDNNPCVYYECGYAIALKKEVITVTDKFSNLPFDIRDRNAIAYGKDLSRLERHLENRLTNIMCIK